jgi:hypothetical protein
MVRLPELLDNQHMQVVRLLALCTSRLYLLTEHDKYLPLGKLSELNVINKQLSHIMSL